MGMACRMLGGNEQCLKNCNLKLERKRQLEDLDVDGRTHKKYLREI
jgi:hypothetical protein